MKDGLMKYIRRGVIIAGITLVSLIPFQKISADDIYKGIRGPTSWQLDSRVSYFENEHKSNTTTGNIILKYWKGDEFGLISFLNLPYKNINSLGKSSIGVGDISLGCGPRGRLDNFHWISYVSTTFPTGDDKSKPTLGNGRLDIKTGLLGTYITSDKRYELDGIVERNFTGKNDSGLNSSDETYIGILGGREITKKLRFVTGTTCLVKDNGNYITNWRVIIRYTVSPKLHFELAGDKGIDGYNVPKSTGIGFYMRNNKF